MTTTLKGMHLLDFFLFVISVVTKPPYEVTETGWGEFEVVIKIYFNDQHERPVSLLTLNIIFFIINELSHQNIWHKTR